MLYMTLKRLLLSPLPRALQTRRNSKYSRHSSRKILPLDSWRFLRILWGPVQPRFGSIQAGLEHKTACRALRTHLICERDRKSLSRYVCDVASGQTCHQILRSTHPRQLEGLRALKGTKRNIYRLKICMIGRKNAGSAHHWKFLEVG